MAKGGYSMKLQANHRSGIVLFVILQKLAVLIPRHIERMCRVDFIHKSIHTSIYPSIHLSIYLK